MGWRRWGERLPSGPQDSGVIIQGKLQHVERWEPPTPLSPLINSSAQKLTPVRMCHLSPRSHSSHCACVCVCVCLRGWSNFYCVGAPPPQKVVIVCRRTHVLRFPCVCTLLCACVRPAVSPVRWAGTGATRTRW